jgi:hypothetical protein
VALKLPKIEDIIPVRILYRTGTYFWCPYCDTSWLRGGGKEGFVKAAASNHVAACRDVVLFDAGYLPALHPHYGRAIPIAAALADTRLPHPRSKQTNGDWYKRTRRMIMATKAARKRAGLTPRKPELHL